MLTASACRWLLADEVGLGKTVQVIMVMRALAVQSSRLFNVALVVPDDLVEQWEKELLARGHAIAIEAGESGGANSNLLMRLIRPSRIVAGGKIAADRIDMLLVDEFTKLLVAVRNELIAAARTIPHVIAMTATPALHPVCTRGELMELLSRRLRELPGPKAAMSLRYSRSGGQPSNCPAATGRRLPPPSRRRQLRPLPARAKLQETACVSRGVHSGNQVNCFLFVRL